MLCAAGASKVEGPARHFGEEEDQSDRLKQLQADVLRVGEIESRLPSYVDSAGLTTVAFSA